MEILFPWNFPCLLCGREDCSLETGLCEGCLSQLKTNAQCPFCGHPGGLCAACCKEKGFLFTGCQFPFLYEGSVRTLLLRYKYGGQKYLARFFAAFMPKPPAGSLLVGVPLHKGRERRRGYNQARELALLLCEACTYADALCRPHATRTQSLLTREERAKNLEGAFTCPHPEVVEGRRVVLVDDILTTGATLQACAKVLLAAGAESVSALTVAYRAPGQNGK